MLKSRCIVAESGKFFVGHSFPLEPCLLMHFVVVGVVIFVVKNVPLCLIGSNSHFSIPPLGLLN